MDLLGSVSPICPNFVAHHREFIDSIAGPNAGLDLLFEFAGYRFAHGDAVYFENRDELFVTGNRFCAPGSDAQEVRISKLALQRDTGSRMVLARRTELTAASAAIPMANGAAAVRWTFDGDMEEENEDAVLICARGTFTRPSGLYVLQVSPPHSVVPVLTTGFYGRRPFNSIHHVVVHPDDGALWFTDPPYGWEQTFREAPKMPSQVYRYGIRDRLGRSLRAVADGFGHPSGLCFTPDKTTLYVTDTDRNPGSGPDIPTRVSSIYAYDVLARDGGPPFLVNRRLFAFVDTGIPLGIKCDSAGNVYGACSDGVQVWSSAGVLLGRIRITGGATNICFGRAGELFILCETVIYRATLADSVRGAQGGSVEKMDESKDGTP